LPKQSIEFLRQLSINIWRGFWKHYWKSF